MSWIQVKVLNKGAIMNVIQKEKLYLALINGAKEVMENRLFLNKINVFPVADGDTGSNLFSTMQSIVANAELKHSLKHTLESIADSAIVGARGNSGLIFAQYLHGISQGIESEESLTTRGFVQASGCGVDYAYEAIENPVEGTMLTTMKAFHESLNQGVSENLSLHDLLDKAYQTVEVAVVNTTNQLAVLKKATVVDSGAKGFAYFIKGFVNGIKGHLKSSDVELVPEMIPEIDHQHEEINFRYCTEALLEGKTVDVNALKKILSGHGDSLIVAGGKRKVRIHLHTDEPHLVFEKLSGTYDILSQKVDDMVKQQTLVHDRKYKHVIVTDSIADLPTAFIDQEQIHVINLNVLLGTESYIDKLTISNQQMFDLSKQRHVHPTSSQPSIKTVENAYNYLLSYYESVMVVTVSKALSGTYNVFKKASETYKDKVHVIDSKQNSVAQGLLVWEAAQALTAGMSVEGIIAQLNHSIDRSKIMVKIKTLDNMIASGRLSVKAGAIAKRMGLKPIVTLDQEGKGAIHKLAFSDKGSLKKILKHLSRIHNEVGIKHFAITYVDDQALGNAFKEAIEEVLQMPCTFIVESSAIIAAGAGRGAVAVSYISH
jgi:DegV family protein with EDD domain